MNGQISRIRGDGDASLGVLILSTDEDLGLPLLRIVSEHHRVARADWANSKTDALAILQDENQHGAFNAVLYDCNNNDADNLFLRILSASGFARDCLVAIFERPDRLGSGFKQEVDFLSKPVGREAVAILLDRLPGTPRSEPARRPVLQIESSPERRFGLRRKDNVITVNQTDIYYFEKYSKGSLVHHAFSMEPLFYDPLDFERLLALEMFRNFFELGERLLVNAREVVAISDDDDDEPVVGLRDAAETM